MHTPDLSQYAQRETLHIAGRMCKVWIPKRSSTAEMTFRQQTAAAAAALNARLKQENAPENGRNVKI